MLLLTSGTTSRPKIVPLTHANLCASAYSSIAALALRETDRCINVVPLFHGHGLNNVLLATVAAGHAAGYCLAAARTRPGTTGRLCLVAPTWRGPLPTVMGKRHAAFRHIARAGDLPAIGDLIYRLNVNPFMVRMMALGHVYRDPGALPERVMAEKLAVTRAAGARHASIRFVVGELDPMTSREEFLDAARQVTEPILVIYGADTPAKSKAEMAELAALPNVRAALLPAGKLAIHEEFAEEVADVLRAFLGGG